MENKKFYYKNQVNYNALHGHFDRQLFDFTVIPLVAAVPMVFIVFAHSIVVAITAIIGGAIGLWALSIFVKELFATPARLYDRSHIYSNRHENAYTWGYDDSQMGMSPRFPNNPVYMKGYNLFKK